MSFRGFILTISLLVVFSMTAIGQRVAIVTPDRSPRDLEYAARFAERIPHPLRVLDSGMADTAFRSINVSAPFNMTVAEGRAASVVIGCDYLMLVRTGAQRRTSLSRSDYYESFATLYLVSGRTGELLLWRSVSFEADAQENADRTLADSVGATAVEIIDKMKGGVVESIPKSTPQIEEVPLEDSPASVGLKPPIPYKRIKPEYTSTAFLYDIRATVEIEADIGTDGTVLATRLARWAGYGLDESADKAVRAMNWRPAMRNGKPLPMRVLLRYNFLKVDKDQE